MRKSVALLVLLLAGCSSPAEDTEAKIDAIRDRVRTVKFELSSIERHLEAGNDAMLERLCDGLDPDFYLEKKKAQLWDLTQELEEAERTDARD